MNKIFVLHFIVSLLVLTIVGTYAEDSGQIMCSVRESDNKLPDKEIANRSSGKSSNDNKDVKAYGILKIKVLEDEALEPVSGVNVMIKGHEEKTSTDLDGRCRFRKLLPGNYELKLKAFCYDSVVIKNIIIVKNDTTNLVVKMKFQGYGAFTHLFGEISTNNFGVIKGQVIDDSLKEPCGGATVLIKGTKYGRNTNLKGTYTIDSIPEGSYTIYTKYSLYMKEEKTVEVRKSDTSFVNFLLKWDTIAIKRTHGHPIDTMPPNDNPR